MSISTYLPFLQWSRSYNRNKLGGDLLASIIVTVMLIPQSLAYAMLAGLPPVTGLYASIAPLLAYTLLGTSRTLSVGPVAVVSLMTAAAVTQVAAPGSAEYASAALLLALISGVFLFVLGVLRLGFLTNLISHPVITGFITASGILIAVSQLKHVLGIEAQGHSLVSIFQSLWINSGGINAATLLIGIGSIGILLYARSTLVSHLAATRLSNSLASLLVKLTPALILSLIHI